MRVLCVGRHRYLSDHLARYFAAVSVTTEAVIGMDEAVAAARRFDPDVVVCDYDVISSVPLTAWEDDADLARIPIIAVSLTRRPNEVNLLDLNGVSGFLYLPTLDRTDVLRVLGAAAPGRVASPPLSLEWSQPTTTAPQQ